MQNLNNYRKNYEKLELLEDKISKNPFELFSLWFVQAEENKIDNEVNAMTISTAGLDGFPKSRVVLLKEYNKDGFIFYTNYNSEKSKSILVNPNVCLSFFWQSQERQVIIKGIATKTTAEKSNKYFSSRPFGSQLGAIISEQSESIPSRSFLENKLIALEIEYASKPIIRPNHWGGYNVKPLEFEFWQGRPNRLHDRIKFVMNDNFSWETSRLSP